MIDLALEDLHQKATEVLRLFHYIDGQTARGSSGRRRLPRSEPAAADPLVELQESVTRLRSRLVATAELLDELYLREDSAVYAELRDALLFDSE